MALIQDLVDRARRTLGDTAGHRWSDPRMRDIVNAGLKDINKVTGAYRDEYAFELMPHRYRYPLPRNLLKLTDLYYRGKEVPVVSRKNRVVGLCATKGQLSRGVIELVDLPIIPHRVKRFYQAPTLHMKGPDQAPLWENNVWGSDGAWGQGDPWGIDPDERHPAPHWGGVDEDEEISYEFSGGVVTDPVEDEFGFTDEMKASTVNFTEGPKTQYGLLASIIKRGSALAFSPVSVGEVYGVMTGIALTEGKAPADQRGSVSDIPNKPLRVIGRYGIATSVLTIDEYVKVYYNSLPPEVVSLSDGFPLAPALESAMVYWIVTQALLDDNDANNNARSEKFLKFYGRELEDETEESAMDYGGEAVKMRTNYIGGIKR